MSNAVCITFDSYALQSWFLSCRRTFPWREFPTPYRVWVSEVMLQQTRAESVVPYFLSWMKEFPNLQKLAQASLDRVMKLWEGLGYYARARNLYYGAQQIMAEYGGDLPSDVTDLLRIKGIGAYTASAIRSFAFLHKVVAVDTNVARVLSRYFNIEEEVHRPRIRYKMASLVERFLEDDNRYVSEGLIELGALVCKSRPRCNECPLKLGCQAFHRGLTHRLPLPKAKKKIVVLERFVAVVLHEDLLLLQKRKSGEVMAGLYEFPYFERRGEPLSILELTTYFSHLLSLSLVYQSSLLRQTHTFTSFRVILLPYLFFSEQLDSRFEFSPELALFQLPFSSGHRKILQNLLQYSRTSCNEKAG